MFKVAVSLKVYWIGHIILRLKPNPTQMLRTVVVSTFILISLIYILCVANIYTF